MFQDRFKKMREKAGYRSQQAFADAFGVAQSTVGGWESGKREPNCETTIRIAKFLNVPVGRLLVAEEPDKYSIIFRDNLSTALEMLDVDGIPCESEAMANIHQLQTLTEDSYPLSLAEACSAADKIGFTLDELLQPEIEKSPDTDKSVPRDRCKEEIIDLVGKMAPEQKELLLAILNTAIARSQGKSSAEQGTTVGTTPKFKHSDRDSIRRRR